MFVDYLVHGYSIHFHSNVNCLCFWSIINIINYAEKLDLINFLKQLWSSFENIFQDYLHFLLDKIHLWH